MISTPIISPSVFTTALPVAPPPSPPQNTTSGGPHLRMLPGPPRQPSAAAKAPSNAPPISKS